MVLAGVALAMTLTGVVVTRMAGHTPYVVEGVVAVRAHREALAVGLVALQPEAATGDDLGDQLDDVVLEGRHPGVQWQPLDPVLLVLLELAQVAARDHRPG